MKLSDTISKGHVRAAVWFSLLLWLADGANLWSAEWSTAWRFEQSLTIPQPGLLKIGLPAETLGAARAGLEDLRLADPAGREVPYVIERSEPPTPLRQPARAFTATLTPDSTVLLLETGLSVPLEGVELATPAADLIKAVTVEGSADRNTWERLVEGAPVFRQTGGLARLRVALPPAAFGWLRLTVDDRRSAPVPFTGVTLEARPAADQTETVPAIVAERLESPGETRLRLTLPAAHLPVAAIELEVSDPVYSRSLRLSALHVIEGAVRETPLSRGTVYRLAFEAVGAVSNQVLRVEQPVPTRDVILTIDNLDSPPLAVTAVRVQWRPVHLVFRAPEAGMYRLLSGNPLCGAPRYDVAALGASLRALPLASILPIAVRTNAAYRAPPTLPTVADTAAPLDTAGWKYRRAILLSQTGVQQLELDLAVLSHAQVGLADLRLLRQTNQVPYVLETGFAHRSLVPAAQAVPDPKRPQVSRWRITLPHVRLPLVRLTCASATPLFERTLTLSEERADDRGDRHRVVLGSGLWRQTPERAARPLTLEFSTPPETDTLWLETHNGDNPPLQLDRFEAVYLTSRLFFKSDDPEDLWLYYGHSASRAARYDLSLAADQLLAAEKAVATLGPEQRLHGLTWQEQFGRGRRGGPLIWGVLIGVVVALLLVVKRLVPGTG